MEICKLLFGAPNSVMFFCTFSLLILFMYFIWYSELLVILFFSTIYFPFYHYLFCLNNNCYSYCQLDAVFCIFQAKWLVESALVPLRLFQERCEVIFSYKIYLVCIAFLFSCFTVNSVPMLFLIVGLNVCCTVSCINDFLN